MIVARSFTIPNSAPAPGERNSLLTGKPRVGRVPDHLELDGCLFQRGDDGPPAGIGATGYVGLAGFKVQRHIFDIGQFGPRPAAPLANASLNSDTWRLIRFEASDPGRGVVSINLLRPNQWATATRADAGRTVTLMVPEMGLRGLATVCSIEACPATASGPIAGLVTGTFATERAQMIGVFPDSLAAPIGATPSHPFYSLDRNDWIRAGNLRAGERVCRAGGESTIGRVELRPARMPVHNLEIHDSHTYFASDAKLWVHNACTPRGRILPPHNELDRATRNIPISVLDDTIDNYPGMKGVRGADGAL